MESSVREPTTYAEYKAMKHERLKKALQMKEKRRAKEVAEWEAKKAARFGGNDDGIADPTLPGNAGLFEESVTENDFDVDMVDSSSPRTYKEYKSMQHDKAKAYLQQKAQKKLAMQEAEAARKAERQNSWLADKGKKREAYEMMLAKKGAGADVMSNARHAVSAISKTLSYSDVKAVNTLTD
jgi:hypothetical protein